jgi:hypothetical protein
MENNIKRDLEEIMYEFVNKSSLVHQRGSGGLCEHRNEPSFFRKMGRISCEA